MASFFLSYDQIDDLAAGCSLLGSGGGGDTHAFSLVLRSLLARGRRVSVVDPDELDPEALIVNVGFVGAPVTLQEKLIAEIEIVSAVEAMRRRLGRPIDALMASEIGGGNGLAPFIAGALLNLPVVDADGMGRAFPLSDHVAYSIYGHSALPTVVASEHGEVAIIEAGNNRQVERLLRALSVAMGSKCFSADYPLRGADVRKCAVPRTVSLALSIGAAVRDARVHYGDPLNALRRLLHDGRGLAVSLLFEGTVVDCQHDVRAGFGVGRILLAQPGCDRVEVAIDFQNEFLIARREGAPIATTPDIISVTDAETFRAISADAVRYGQRVKVIAIAAPLLMCTDLALSVVGPRAFGFDVDYRSIALTSEQPVETSRCAPGTATVSK
jgi:DUF917 family protein